MKFDRRRRTGAGELDVVEPVEDLVEHDVDLHASEVRPEAEVRAAATERDVLVRAALDVEAIRVVGTPVSSWFAAMYQMTTLSPALIC